MRNKISLNLILGIAIVVVIVVLWIVASIENVMLEEDLEFCQKQVPIKEVCYNELRPVCNPYQVECEINKKNREANPFFYETYPMMCWDFNCSEDLEIAERCEVVE